MRTRRWRRADLVLYAALVACGGSATDASGPIIPVTATFSPQTVLVAFIGSSVTAAIAVTRPAGFTDAITLTDSIDGAPPGVTATLNPTTLSGSTLSSVLTLAAASTASPASGNIVVLMTGPNGLLARLPIEFRVATPGINISRAGTGTGTVTSSPAGINCGNTCNATFATGTVVTLTATPAAGSAFAGWTGGNCTGTGACTITAASLPTITATFNSTAPSFSFGVTPTTASVPQGGNTTATVSITRVNGFAGGVTLATSGAPTGLTVVANPSSVTGNTATLNIAAASSVAASNYPITITASASGLPTQTAALAVQVTPGAGGSGNLALNFSTCDPSEVPIWFGVQNGTAPWTRVTAGPNNTFTFAAGATGGFAWVTSDGTRFITNVMYGSRDEITALALGNPCGGAHESIGTSQLTGTLAAVPATGTVIAIGGAVTEWKIVQGSNFTMPGVAAGRRDLIAAATNINTNGTRNVARLIVRRDVVYATSIPALTFNGPEAFIPQFYPITWLNATGDQVSGSVSLITPNGATGPYFQSAAGPNGGLGYIAIPDSLLQPAELYALTVFAASSETAFRLASVVRHSAGADTVTFGPALNQPAVTSLGTSPYLRLHASLASQSAYTAAANAEFDQSTASVTVTVMAGYSGNAPATWSVDVPDLSAAGYDAKWGLKSGTPVEWSVIAAGGDVLPLIGATPADGQRALVGAVTNTSSAFSVARKRASRWVVRRESFAPIPRIQSNP